MLPCPSESDPWFIDHGDINHGDINHGDPWGSIAKTVDETKQDGQSSFEEPLAWLDLSLCW